MGKASGTITFHFHDVDVDAMNESDAIEELQESANLMAELLDGVSGGTPVGDPEVSITEFKGLAVAEVTITATVSLTVAYNPDDQDLYTLVNENAEDIFQQGDVEYEVEIDNEDTDEDPMYADQDLSNS